MFDAAISTIDLLVKVSCFSEAAAKSRAAILFGVKTKLRVPCKNKKVNDNDRNFFIFNSPDIRFLSFLRFASNGKFPRVSRFDVKDVLKRRANVQAVKG